MRPIDANELYEKTAELEAQALAYVEKLEPTEDHEEWVKWSAILTERTAFKYDVADAPTVDTVPVVRCKDCKNRNRYECDHIKLGETKCGAHDDWFCADGERREDESN